METNNDIYTQLGSEEDNTSSSKPLSDTHDNSRNESAPLSEIKTTDSDLKISQIPETSSTFFNNAMTNATNKIISKLDQNVDEKIFENDETLQQIPDQILKKSDNIINLDVECREENVSYVRSGFEKSTRSSTKEEKQRQNEELLIHESSSISSETGSWDIIVTANSIEAKEVCKLFLSAEKEYYDSVILQNKLTHTLDTSQHTSLASGACFIDASTLFDEEELSFVNINATTQSSQSEMPGELSDTTGESDKNLVFRIDGKERMNESVTGNSSNTTQIDVEMQEKARRIQFAQQEKISGDILFKNSINQFSGHVITPNPSFASTEGYLSHKFLNDPDDIEPYGIFLPETPFNSIIQIPSHSELQVAHTKFNDEFSLGSDNSAIIENNSEKCIIHQKLDDKSIISENDECGPKDNNKSNLVCSWTVDMSNYSTLDSCNELQQQSSQKQESLEGCLGNTKTENVGYFIDLSCFKLTETKPGDVSNVIKSSDTIVQKKDSTGFFIDISDIKNKSVLPENKPDNPDKKNIFSMFIDLGDKKPINKREPFSLTSKLSRSLNQKSVIPGHERVLPVDLEKEQSVTTEEISEPFLRRPQNLSMERHKLSSKRHSWNATNPLNISEDDMAVEASDVTNTSDKYKRPISLSNEDNVTINISEEMPCISKSSSMSIDSPLSSFNAFSRTKSDVSIFSNNSITSDHSKCGNKLNKLKQGDVKINQTFDKSSLGSITDGIFSKETSPGSETDEVTFQNESQKKQSQIIEKTNLAFKSHTMETLHATIEKQKLLLETVTENHVASPKSSNIFVKLSDLDKPVNKFELHSSMDQMTTSNESRVAKLFSQHKYAKPVTNMSRSTGNNAIYLNTSFENSKSLSRLFPHLSKGFSSSLPSDVGYNSLEKNETSDYMLSEVSYTSSVTSSRSGFDSNDESSLSCRQPRRLGEDLLKMFLQEIATDILLEVGNKKIKAHKCILRSRCQYFAAILAGSWVQNAGNVIKLPGYSYDVVHFALCHIYSGAAYPPEGISLMELAGLADLLGLEGLKEVTAHALRKNYCHNFHKPCYSCVDGIVQVLPVSLNHGLDDLYRKCLKWVCRHYMKVWSTRRFAQLNYDIICRCRQQLAAHINSENVLNTFLDCTNLLAAIGSFKWASNVEYAVRELIEISQSYISEHFASLIASDSFLSLGHGVSWNISRLENLLLKTASTLTAHQACKSYQRCTRLNAVLAANVITIPGNNLTQNIDRQEEMDWSNEFVRLVSAILSTVEQCLTRQCARAMKVSAWQRMDLELRKKIQQLACLSGPIERKSRNNDKLLSSQNRIQVLNQLKLAFQTHTIQKSMQNEKNSYHATASSQTNNHDRLSVNLRERSEQMTKKPDVMFSNKLQKNVSRTKIPTSLFKGKGETHIDYKSTKLETNKLEKAATTCNIPNLSSVKPRYLNPKKSNLTNNNLTLSKSKKSSSESSTRTSSPACRKPITNKKINDSNISLDSLSSPARSSHVLISKNDAYNSTGSLCKLPKTSIRDDSQSFKTSNISLQKSNSCISGPKTTLNKENISSKVIKPSENTNSANRRYNNPKKSTAEVLAKPKISFLSARSREILAKRNQSKQSSSAPVLKSSSESPVNTTEKLIINKSSSSSNMLNRRLNSSGTYNNSKNSSEKNSVIKGMNPKKAKQICNKKVITNQVSDDVIGDSSNENHISEPCESKLERSSTFCKERSDIPSQELQIIE